MSQRKVTCKTLTCCCVNKTDVKVVAVGGENGQVAVYKLFRPESAKKSQISLVRLCDGHTSSVTSIRLTDSGDMVLAGSNGGSIRMWSIDGSSTKVFSPGHRSRVTALKMHPFSHYFASASTDTNIKVWDLGKRKATQDYKKHMNEITALEFSPDGRLLVSGDKTGRIYVWNLERGRFFKTLKGHMNSVTDFCFHQTHMFLASCSTDKTAIVWDVDKMKPVVQTIHGTTKITLVLLLEKQDTKEELCLCCATDNVKMWKWKPLECVDVVDAKWPSGLLDYAYLPSGDDKGNKGRGQKILGVTKHSNVVRLWILDFNCLAPWYDKPKRQVISNRLEQMSVAKHYPTVKTPTTEDDFNVNFGVGPGPGHGIGPPGGGESSKRKNDMNMTQSLPVKLKAKKKRIVKKKKVGGKDDDFFQTFMEGGWKMCSILNLRYQNYTLLKNLWFIDEHSRLQMLKRLCESEDDTLLMNIMTNIFMSEASSRLITIEMCEMMLKLHSRLLKSNYEGYITTAIKNVRTLTKKFLPQIVKMAQDFERKDQEKIGKACLKNIKNICSGLKTLSRDSVYGEDINSRAQYLWTKLSKLN